MVCLIDAPESIQDGPTNVRPKYLVGCLSKKVLKYQAAVLQPSWIDRFVNKATIVSDADLEHALRRSIKMCMERIGSAFLYFAGRGKLLLENQ